LCPGVVCTDVVEWVVSWMCPGVVVSEGGFGGFIVDVGDGKVDALVGCVVDTVVAGVM
jgi:hypothetical protein